MSTDVPMLYDSRVAWGDELCQLGGDMLTTFRERLRRAWMCLKGFDPEHLDVAMFHTKFSLMLFDEPGHLTKRKLRERIECMQEELREFAEGVDEQDLTKQADALIDLVYFAKGTACMLGLPWQDLWVDVQRSNMSKVRGTTHRGHAVDVTKPLGWIGPQTMEILAYHNYDADEWFGLDGDPLEKMYRDDIPPHTRKRYQEAA